MKKIIRIFLWTLGSIVSLCIILFTSCTYKNHYILDIENIDELRNAIINTEKYMKKIEVVPRFDKRRDVVFDRLDEGHINLTYSSLNYNSNDSIIGDKYNRNEQLNVDSCQLIPELSSEKWKRLKNNLAILKRNHIDRSINEYYNDRKFCFFYYSYKFDKYITIGPPAYITVLPEEITKTDGFKQRFIIKDRKGDLYLLIRADRT